MPEGRAWLASGCLRRWVVNAAAEAASGIEAARRRPLARVQGAAAKLDRGRLALTRRRRVAHHVVHRFAVQAVTDQGRAGAGAAVHRFTPEMAAHTTPLVMLTGTAHGPPRMKPTAAHAAPVPACSTPLTARLYHGR